MSGGKGSENDRPGFKQHGDTADDKKLNWLDTVIIHFLEMSFSPLVPLRLERFPHLT